MKKKIRKWVGAIFLVLAIALTQVPASVVEAISQNSDFEKKGDTLISYTGTASVVSVPVGVKTVGTEAFSNCGALESVSFPGSVKTIDNGAFRRCQNLKTVTLSSGQTEIGSGAFSMCKSLTGVKLSDTVEKLGAGVFSGDAKLQTVDLGGNKNFIIEDGAIYNKDKTMLIQVLAGRASNTFIMPDSVTDIERYAFWGCKNLNNVTLSSNLYDIPEYSFSNCSNLQNITIPLSVKKISAKAFEDCNSLNQINIPASVINIHDTAFDGCNQLKINAEEGTTAYEFSRNRELNQANVMEQDESVSDNAIGNLYGEEDKKETLSDNSVSDNSGRLSYFNKNNPADVSNADVSEYYANDNSNVIGKTRVVANHAVVMMDSDQSQSDLSNYTDEENNDSMSDSDTSSLKQPAFIADQTIQDDGSHFIKRKEYYQSNSLSNAALESGITKVNDFSFARSSLKGIQLPEGLTSIGYGAFYHCDSLKQVVFPTTVTSIEPEAFTNTSYLDNWKKSNTGNDFLIVGDGLLLAYKGNDNNVTIPDNVKKICGGVFKNNSTIAYVTIPDSTIEIGEEAFSDCSNLIRVTGGTNLTKICDRAFSGSPITQIHLPDKLAQVGVGAFEGIGTNAVVFESTQNLPQISFEKTATRLSNTAYRKTAFSNISVAAITANITNLEDTVLDEDYLGMKGLTVTLIGTDNNASKSAVLRYCTMIPDASTGLVKVPSSVQVDGETYEIVSADQNAFKPYESIQDWTDAKITGIILPAKLGTITDYEPNLAFDTNLADISNVNTNTTNATNETNATTSANNKNDTANTEINYVTTTDLGSGYPNGDKIQADCVDDDMQYRLLVNQVPDEENKLLKQVSTTYGVPVDGQLLSFDLKLVEKDTNIPITNFESEKVIIRIPLSKTMNQQNICAVSLMEDGSLETIYGTKKTIDDVPYFCFTTNHFSSYGIYAGIGETGEKIKEQTKLLKSKDDSPETGDFFDVRYLLGIALACIGLVLILNKGMFKKRK